MDEQTKKSLISKYKKALMQSAMGKAVQKDQAIYKKQKRKKEFYIRRGLKAETKLTQLRSIPFLSKG